MGFTKLDLQKLIDDSEAIVIGAGAGLSTAAGFEYGGDTFLREFPRMHEKYGYEDMYSAGFHPFLTKEEKWGYWSKMIYLLRYKEGAKDLYKRLLAMVQGKDYFVITTNVDHQFQLAGFDKNRLFYMQGDYGLFQCALPCHQKTYDNKEMVLSMVKEEKDGYIPSSLIPKCPVCGRAMETNLRCDDRFVQDAGWYEAKKRYDDFIAASRDKKVLYLELGVGYSTPVWIKYPFMKYTYANPKAMYVVVDRGYIEVPREIQKQTISVHQNIDSLI